MLKNKKLIVGVTGSIAAFKSALLVRELIKAGATVNVVMTPSATNFITPLTLSNLSKNPVVIDMFDKDNQASGAWHIQLAHWCDAMIIAPCSATTIGKIANGICDSALVTVSIALPGNIPLIIAPAMDSTMWLSPAVQRNIKLLARDGAIIIPPEEGDLASGLSGPGRLPDTEVLMKSIISAINDIPFVTKKVNFSIPVSFTEKEVLISDETEEEESDYEQALREGLEMPIYTIEDAVEKDKWSAEYELEEMKNSMKGNNTANDYLKGKKVLITAGPTREKIDDVRFISNYSSGKMGYALASEARKAGADVVLISGPVSISAPEDIRVINVLSAKEMFDTTINEFTDSDISILAAAVSDYKPLNTKTGKIKKEIAGSHLTLELAETDDILATLGKSKKNNRKVIGFALESENEIENGWKKLHSKNCDMLVVNSANKPQSGFEDDYNTITILTRDGKEASFPPMTKAMCSQIILKKIAGL